MNVNRDQSRQNLRRTKIVCTLGPASESEEMLKELMLAGMNVARFNFSHGTHQEIREKFERVLKVRRELDLPVATMLDTKGPEIRLRDFEGGRAELLAGQQFVLTTEEIPGTAERAAISYKNLKNDIQEGMTLLINDGLVELTVEKIQGEEIVCRVIHGGTVSNHKGINVPGAVLSMPYISQADREDILFGIEMGYDLLAASFVRCKEDILELKKLISDNGGNMKIIAKIENMQGIRNLEEILDVSDGVMVARGDLGVEIPFEEVPMLQKKMIRKANEMGKITITATQMLESMIQNPRPTRAEAADIANAIFDGTSAIMLSGESAAGKYPIQAVKVMASIAMKAEAAVDYTFLMENMAKYNKKDITTAIAYATCSTAKDLGAAAIITVTISGYTAEAIARFRPECPVIGCTVSEKVYNQLSQVWGIRPLLLGQESNADALFADAVAEAVRRGCVKKGDIAVLTAGVPLGVAGNTNMIKVVEV